jgi:hypothetical protein
MEVDMSGRTSNRAVFSGLLLLIQGLIATTATATHIPPGPVDIPDAFTVTPGAIGAPEGPFTATFLDYSYAALVDQSGLPGLISQEGAGFVSSFRHPDLATVLDASTTGLGVSYRLVAKFSATGAVVPNAIGGVDVSFDTFSLEIFADPLKDDSIVVDGVGAPDGTVSIAGTADDILVAHSVGVLAPFAGGHVFPGLANGDFDVILEMELDSPYISDGPSKTFWGISGVNTALVGLGPGAFTDGLITGSGNVVKLIPEPASLALLGIGVATLCARRTRRS